MILKCVALCRCSVEVEVVGLYTRLSSHEEAERFRRHFRISAGTSNIYTI